MTPPSEQTSKQSKRTIQCPLHAARFARVAVRRFAIGREDDGTTTMTSTSTSTSSTSTSTPPICVLHRWCVAPHRDQAAADVLAAAVAIVDAAEREGEADRDGR